MAATVAALRNSVKGPLRAYASLRVRLIHTDEDAVGDSGFARNCDDRVNPRRRRSRDGTSDRIRRPTTALPRRTGETSGRVLPFTA